MIAFENGKQYALSSNSSAFDGFQSSETKTYVFLKLTDSAYRAIEEYQNDLYGQGNKKKAEKTPIIQFNGDSGILKLPVRTDECRSYKFSLAQCDSSNRSTCIKQDGVRSGSRDIQTLGTMCQKITICADDDVYEQTRVRMTQADEENKKICTKEIKPGGKYRGKWVKKPASSSSTLVKEPEFKPSLRDRLLTQRHNPIARSSDVVKPGSRIAHTAKTSDSPMLLSRTNLATKPVVAKGAEPIPTNVAARPHENSAEGLRAAFTKVDDKSAVSRLGRSPNNGRQVSPIDGPTASTNVVNSSPTSVDVASSLTLKRPGRADIGSNPAKKARCSTTLTDRPDQLSAANENRNLLDSAAALWSNNAPPNAANRNFFSDRPSPDYRPKLAVQPMPATKQSALLNNDTKSSLLNVDKSSQGAAGSTELPLSPDNNNKSVKESVKENHAVERDFTSQYSEIVSVAQRLRYKQDFNQEYDEYQRLHHNISCVSKKFHKMELDLKCAEEGSSVHEAIKKRIIAEYVACKKDPRYVTDKRRFDHLHKKLSYIKKLIFDYDNREIGVQT